MGIPPSVSAPRRMPGQFFGVATCCLFYKITNSTEMRIFPFRDPLHARQPSLRNRCPDNCGSVGGNARGRLSPLPRSYRRRRRPWRRGRPRFLPHGPRSLTMIMPIACSQSGVAPFFPQAVRRISIDIAASESAALFMPAAPPIVSFHAAMCPSAPFSPVNPDVPISAYFHKSFRHDMSSCRTTLGLRP